MIQNLISFFFFLLNDSSKYLIYLKVSHQWHFWYLGPGDSLFGGCPVPCRMFSNISDHCQILVALHQLWQPKMPLDVAQGPLGNRSTPNWQPLIYPSPEMIWNTILTTKYILIYHIHLVTFQNFLFSSNYLMSILRLYKKESQTVFIIVVLNEPLISIHSCFSSFFSILHRGYFILLSDWMERNKRDPSGIRGMGGAPHPHVMSKRPTLGGTGRHGSVCDW